MVTTAGWGKLQGGWAVAQSQMVVPLRTLRIATIEMMQYRAMLSPCYLQMKDEAVVNITSMGFTHCMKAITCAPMISFTLFFAGDEAHIQG